MQAPARRDDFELDVELASALPERLAVGRGAVLPVSGWYRAPGQVRQLELIGAGPPRPVELFGFEPDPGVQEVNGPGARCFVGLLSLPPEPGLRRLTLGLRATLSDGRVAQAQLGALGVMTAARQSLEPAAWPAAGSGPLIAIGLATHQPRFDLLARQLRSIQQQDHRDFVCLICDDGSGPEIVEGIRALIGDDARFSVFEFGEPLGFYGNFERCLERTPAGADFVAFADQDDAWYPDKLSTLLGAFRPETMLVYSDMRIVDDRRRVLAASMWERRENNFRDLASLLMANTVTGAAMLFRRELLSYALPFPPPVGRPFHDHWLACVALALGEIAYVDRALYDYVQHDSNAFGHRPEDCSRLEWSGPVRSAEPSIARSVDRWRRVYLRDVLRIVQLARTLELRCGARLDAPQRAAVRRCSNLGGSPSDLTWLLLRAWRHRRPTSPTLGAERELLRACIWRHAVRLARSRSGRDRREGRA